MRLVAALVLIVSCAACSSGSTRATTPPATISTTDATTASTTTTTIVPPTTTLPGATACGLASAAFCETFDAAHNGGTQTGDLDPTLWGVSRSGAFNPSQGLINSFVMSHNACANGAASPIPSDARVCNGQYVESQNDGGSVTMIDSYPKQPFNFAGRTGKVVFDVSADSDGTHGAWPEFEITDAPIPGTRGFVSSGPLPALNSVGFSLAGGTAGPGGVTGVDHIFMSTNGVYSEIPITQYGVMTKGSSSAMNHIEVDVSTTRIDIYGTDAGSSTPIHLAGGDTSLNFSQGLVWINDVHYNARKAIEPCQCGTEFNHTFTWDNLGFDGPKTYRDWGFDVPYAHVPNTAASQSGDPTYVQEGFALGSPRALTVTGVNLGVATGAKVVLNSNNWNGQTLTLSVNGNAPITHSLGAAFSEQSFSMLVPLSQVVAGTNTLTFSSDDGGNTVVTNVTLIMVAAAPVP